MKHYYTKILADSRDTIPHPSGSTIHMCVPHTAETLLQNPCVCCFHKYPVIKKYIYLS